MNLPAQGALLAVLAKVPDPRGRQGLRFSIAAMLAATICGILTGATGCEAIAQWLRNQEPHVWHTLGFTRKPPCANAFRLLLARIDPTALEKVLSAWMQQLIDDATTAKHRGTSLDGKTLCNTLQAHGRSIHLLALFDHETGGVLRQLEMPSDTNEHKAALQLLSQVCLKGLVVTGDAIFCQRDLCQQVVDNEGDYLIKVGDNQPGLKASIADDFMPGFSPLHRAVAS